MSLNWTAVIKLNRATLQSTQAWPSQGHDEPLPICIYMVHEITIPWLFWGEKRTKTEWKDQSHLVTQCSISSQRPKLISSYFFCVCSMGSCVTAACGNKYRTSQGQGCQAGQIFLSTFIHKEKATLASCCFHQLVRWVGTVFLNPKPTRQKHFSPVSVEICEKRIFCYWMSAVLRIQKCHWNFKFNLL